MKKIKFLFLATMTLIICSCGADLSLVAEDIRLEMESQIEAELNFDVTVGDIVLVHAGGNKYESIVTVWGNGESAQFALDVTWDGYNYSAIWEPIN